LEDTRIEGNSAGLVVLGTGLGKTWLCAFDSTKPEFKRVLFVAHREEILGQAIKTFRRIRPSASIGRYTGTEKVPDADILFASIQTLGRHRHLRQFEKSRFDYIVIDEFHHAAAQTYRNLIQHFTPKFLLGLTATPERTDGGDLLELCQENLVYRCDFDRGIRQNLLVPFHYFGVPDEVDYSNIPWRSNRFDEEELTRVVATQKRAQNALEHYRLHAGKRTLAFCCSQRHCDFMAEFFCQNGLRAVAVHSGDGSAPRAASLEALEAGELDMVLSVDMFNEGVDMPGVDTVMMLRPTESTILWLQQFGRGLRKAENKERLIVIDYIGNHRIFLNKPRILLNLPAGDHCMETALNLLREGKFELPPGCEVTYELQTIDILRSLFRKTAGIPALESFYRDFKERHGQRPTATEIFHENYLPGTMRSSYGSWLHFVKAMGDLAGAHLAAFEQNEEFLSVLETTRITSGFKMLILKAMLDQQAFPGSISIRELSESFRRLVKRSAVFQNEVGAAMNDSHALIQFLEANLNEFWTGEVGPGDRHYFTCKDGALVSSFSISSDLRESFHELVRELVDWRLAEHLNRAKEKVSSYSSQFICKVSHSSHNPILRLPDRERHPEIPSGKVAVDVDGKSYEMDFVKIAVNVMREFGPPKNVLPGILTQWFGSDAGRPGTRFKVIFERNKAVWCMKPFQWGKENDA
jgi:hypothetical protein